MNIFKLKTLPIIAFLVIGLTVSPLSANAGDRSHNKYKSHSTKNHSRHNNVNRHSTRSHIRHNNHRRHSNKHRHNHFIRQPYYQSYYQSYDPYHIGHYHNNSYCTIRHFYSRPYVNHYYEDDEYYDDTQFSVGIHTNNLDLIFND